MSRGSVTAVVATVIATTAVLSGCVGDADGEETAVSTPPHVPLSTTTTTEPTSTTSSTKDVAPPPDAPQAEHLLRLAKDQMLVASSVTIDAVLQSEKGPVELHAEGSSGGGDGKAGGASRTVLKVKGGTIEMIIVGDSRWIKADKAFIEEVVPRDSPVREHPDKWIRLPDGDESIESFRPYHLIRGRFFSENLTTWDARRGAVIANRLDGAWAFRATLLPASSGGKVVREIWTTPDTQRPVVRMLSFGRYPARSELRFTRWGKSKEDWAGPTGAVELRDHGESPFGSNLLEE